MRFSRVFLAFLCSTLLLQGAPVSAAVPQPQLGLHLAACTVGKTKTPARCGTFGVYENRRAGSGRIIALNVAVIPAKHPAHRAIAEIAGGPGQAATEFAPIIADGQIGIYKTLRDSYDVILMDDRGMGKSNPFLCNFTPRGDPASYMRELFPVRLETACRNSSLATHDLSKYNTNETVDDLDALRAALGYDKIILSGGSYGTFFSMVYMRRHPEHVESAVLDGVDPPHFQAIPGEPMGAQTALNDLFKKCRSDRSCNAHFPQFEQHFKALTARFDSGPLTVPVWNAALKRTQQVALSKQVFVDQIRHVLYDPFPASYLPYVTERAYAGDYAPLGRMIQVATQAIVGDLNAGAFLSYSCSDWMPFVSAADLAYAKVHSYAGALRFDAQRAACKIWNVPAMPATFNAPVRSTIPVLMIFGSDDPATPPHYGEQALKYLPNGAAIMVKGGGHGADTACTDKLVVAFVRAHSARGLALTKCVATLKLPPFATSMKGWPAPQ